MIVCALRACGYAGGRWGGKGGRGRLLLCALLQKVRGVLVVRLWLFVILDSSLRTAVRVVVAVLTVGQRP